MRYCPNCKKNVETSFTGGQAILLIFLFLFCFPIAILYAILHTKKCPSCGCATVTERTGEKIKESK